MPAITIKPTAHVVDVLGNVIGRDQPILRMEKALEMVSLLGSEVFEDQNIVFFDPFCKAGELLLACAFYSAWAKAKNKPDLLDMNMVFNEIFLSNRYFGLAPDERHHRLSIRTFLGNKNSHDEKFNHIIRDGHYLSEIDGKLNKQKFDKEFNSMIEYIKKKTGNKKIIAVGNPPYQEADGGGNGKSAIPIYNKFTEKLLDIHEILEFVLVIPSRWFAGGKGLDSFRHRLISSKNIKNLVNFSNSSLVFPTVDINGGVCFLHVDKKSIFNHLNFNENLTEFKIDLRQSDIIPDDPYGLLIYEKIRKKWKKLWVSDVAFPRNVFGISSDFYAKIPNETCRSGLICFFLRKQTRVINVSQVTKGRELIQKYKVVVSKAAGGSKGKRRSTIPTSVIFIIKPQEICSETYSVIQVFKTLKEALTFESYLKTDFARYLVGLRKITQNLSKETWKWVPLIDTAEYWTDEKLFNYFNLTKEEQAHIKKKVQEWS